MIYAIGVVINRAVSFIMLPIYTQCLTPADYGTLELLVITTDIFSMIFGVGISGAIFRYYFRYENQKDRNMVISTSSILLTCSFFIAVCLGFAFSEGISLIVFGTQEASYFFRLCFISLFFQSFIEIPLIFIRAQQRPFLFVGISIAKLALQLSLNIYFVVIKDLHIVGVLYSMVISSILIGVILMGYTLKNVGIRFRSTLAGSMIVFGAPLIISNLASFIYTFSDRYFLKIFTDTTEVGIYSLGYKFGFVLWVLVVSPIFSIWGPKRFEIAKKPDAIKINQQVFIILNFFIISVALGISLFVKDLFRVMSSPSFWPAHKVVPLVLIAYIVQSWILFTYFGIFYKGKTKYMAWANSISAGSIIILNFALIPWLKSYGAAIATIIAFLIRWIIVYYNSQKLYRLYLPWNKCMRIFILSVIIYIINHLFNIDHLFFSICKSSFLFIFYLLLLYYLPIFTLDEKDRVVSIFRNWIEKNILLKQKGKAA